MLASGSTPGSDTEEAPGRNYDAIDIETLVALNVENEGNVNHVAIAQGCSILSCGQTMIPKAVCTSKAIAIGGGYNEIWNRIQECGLTADKVRWSQETKSETIIY